MDEDMTRFRSSSMESGSFSDVFNKRHRAGSISGRLRAASDLEERGLIDKQTKGFLKDKIITGDPALQAALDKYDQGDSKDLEAILKRGELSRGDSVDLLDGLDLDFLNFSKGGMFQNFDDVDVGFDNLDDIGGFRLRGMSDIEGIMGGPESHDLDIGTDSKASGNRRPPAGSFDSDIFPPYSMTQSRIQAPDNVKFEPGTNGFPPDNTVYPNEFYGPAPTGSDREALFNGSSGGANASGGNGAGNSSQLGTSPLQYSPMDSMYTSNRQQASGQGMRQQAIPQGSYLQTGQNLVYGSQYATSGQQPGYGEAQNVGYSMGSGMSAGSYMQGDGKMGMSSTKEKGFIGAYSPEARRERIERFVEKRKKRVWTKKVKYDVRKNFADSRLRVKGRFVKKEDEEVLRDLMTIQP